MTNLAIEFKAQPTKAVEGLPTSISGIAYSGAVINNHGELGDVVVDLENINIPESMLLLNDHNRSQRFGLCRVNKEGDSLVMTAALLEDETTLTFRRQLAISMPIGLSIGVIGNSEKPKTETIVNGRVVKPTTILRNATLLEVSVVSFGADSGAKITAAFASATIQNERQLSAVLFNQVANGYALR